MMADAMYILRGITPVRCDDPDVWIKSWETDSCVVAQDRVGLGVYVTTVFLRWDYANGRGPRPVLFETMVRGDAQELDFTRYCTWEEAEAGHKRIVRRIQKRLDKHKPKECE